jgi:hypothetical protein
LAVIATVLPAQSGPLGSAITSLRFADIAGSGATEAAYRLCVTDGGVRRCRWVEIYGPGTSGYRAPRPYGYRVPGSYGYAAPGPYGYRAPGGYGYAAPSPGVVLVNPPPVLPFAPVFRNPTEYYPTEPNDYPVGISRWWRNMDRWDQGGNGSH